MGLFSFLQRKKTPAPETRRRTAPPQDPVTVEALRTRARRRLIGAAVLVGGAVLGLPALFDKPPRPANQTFQVRMASGDTAATVTSQATAPARVVAPVASSPALPSSATVALATATAGAAAVVLPGTLRKPPADEAIITEPKVDAKAEAAAEKLRAEKARAEKVRADKLKEEKTRKAKEAKEAREAKAAQEAREAAEVRREAARKENAAKEVREAKAAKAAKEAKDADKPRRYVIQAGSFSEAAAARDLGRRIDKLGLDSHEQRVETASGSPRTRVRLGPFQSKDEALRAAARLKAAGLNAAVLPL